MSEVSFILMIFGQTLSVALQLQIEINVSFNLMHPESVYLVQEQYKLGLCLNETINDVENMSIMTTFELL